MIKLNQVPPRHRCRCVAVSHLGKKVAQCIKIMLWLSAGKIEIFGRLTLNQTPPQSKVPKQ